MEETQILLEFGPLSILTNKNVDIPEFLCKTIEPVKYKFKFTGDCFSANDKLKIREKEIEEGIHTGDNSFFYEIKNGAVFFDQTPYTITIELKDADNAYIFTPNASLEESGPWHKKSAQLIVSLNFGNDIGHFELCWEWESKDGEMHKASMSTMVYSTKLDINSHYKTMLKDVENRFQWVTLDLLRNTAWNWDFDDITSSGDWQSWLLIFQRERTMMEDCFKRIINRHRKRLVAQKHAFRAEQLKRIAPRMEEQVAEGILDRPDKRYLVDENILTSDTIENQYMKYILHRSIEELNGIHGIIKEKKEFSRKFKERLVEWSTTWTQMKEHRFWKGISSFSGMRRASLILSQDPLYAGIVRSWHKLNKGLKLFETEYIYGGIQNIAQLYEIWCFVQIDKMIKHILKQAQSTTEVIENSCQKTEKIPTKTILLKYSHPSNNKVIIELIFQAYANSERHSDIWPNIISKPNPQKPDIVLRIHRNDLPKQPVYTWIFDSKYRITNSGLAPADAIDQMHRYRDAILWVSDIKSKKFFQRESLGAFVLYPGDNDTSRENYEAVINEVNIGAFSLKPNSEINTNLEDRLEKLIQIESYNTPKSYTSIQEENRNYFANVPSIKMDLTAIIAKCTTRKKMNQKYWAKCRLYRLPIGVLDSTTSPPDIWNFIMPFYKSKVFGIFPIRGCAIMKRKKIKEIYKKENVEMGGEPQKDDKDYYLFRLEDPIEIPKNFDKSIPKNKIVELDTLI